MRAALFLIGSVALFLGACSSKGGHVTPPPLPNKEWVTGKWKNTAAAQFVLGYEFDKDGVVRVMFQGMKEAISGRYTWSSERKVDLEYSKTAELQEAYQAAVKAYKEWVKDRINKKELDGRAGPSLMAMVAETLPDKETFSVGIVDPKYLVLTLDSGISRNLERAD